MSDKANDFFAHYGIKGMRWGVSRPEGSNGRVDRTAVGVSTDKRGRIQTTGGAGLEPHGDAVKAKIAKQKAKSSGVDALSNEDLQGLIKRMNLEQDYKRLNPQQVSAGKKFANEAGKIAANTARGIAQQEANAYGKKAAAFGKQFAAAMADEAARSSQKRKPKDGGTYTIVRKAIGGN